MRPIQLWFCYQTADPFTPEPRPWPTSHPPVLSGNCVITGAQAPGVPTIHESGVGNWKVQIALSQLESRLVQAGKIKAHDYMKLEGLNRNMNMRFGGQLRDFGNKGLVRNTAMRSMDGVWEGEEALLEHNGLGPLAKRGAGQGGQCAAKTARREARTSYTRVNDRDENSRSPGKHENASNGSDSRARSPLSSLENQFLDLTEARARAEVRKAYAKALLERERNLTRDQSDYSEPSGNQNGRPNRKHYCIISGHIFRSLNLLSLPRGAVVNGVPAWRINARGDEEAVPVRIKCDACRLDIEGTIWQCDIPVCGQEVCRACAQRLEKEWMNKAVGSWEG